MANVVENLGKLERRVTISLPKDAVQKEVDSRIRQLAKNVRMPGFRPGKVPLKMVTQQYSGQVEAEVLSDKVGKEFFDISRAENLRVAGQPSFAPKTDATENDYAFDATFERYAVSDATPAKVYLRQPAPTAKTIAVVGGGFTGSMTLANLLRFASEATDTAPLHIVLIDRQPAIADGVAYRTNDARHLLNVPAGRMSAWPERPDDFLQWATRRRGTVVSGDFLPREWQVRLLYP